MNNNIQEIMIFCELSSSQVKIEIKNYSTVINIFCDDLWRKYFNHNLMVYIES